MLTNYFKIAFRNLFKHRGYSLINIAGLAIGMASCLLILLYVSDELSYDRFHKHVDRIYRATIESAQGQIEVTPSIVGPLFQREFPEVERMARLYETTKYGAVVVQHQERLFKRFYEARAVGLCHRNAVCLAGHASLAAKLCLSHRNQCLGVRARRCDSASRRAVDRQHPGDQSRRRKSD